MIHVHFLKFASCKWNFKWWPWPNFLIEWNCLFIILCKISAIKRGQTIWKYFTCRLSVTRAFILYRDFWPSDLHLNFFLKTLQFGHGIFSSFLLHSDMPIWDSSEFKMMLWYLFLNLSWIRVLKFSFRNASEDRQNLVLEVVESNYLKFMPKVNRFVCSKCVNSKTVEGFLEI